MTMSQRLDSSPGSRPAKSMLIVSAFTPQTSAHPFMTSTAPPPGGCRGVGTTPTGGKRGSPQAPSLPPCTKRGAAASPGAPATTSPSNSSPNPVLTARPPNLRSAACWGGCQPGVNPALDSAGSDDLFDDVARRRAADAGRLEQRILQDGAQGGPLLRVGVHGDT